MKVCFLDLGQFCFRLNVKTPNLFIRNWPNSSCWHRDINWNSLNSITRNNWKLHKLPFRNWPKSSLIETAPPHNISQSKNKSDNNHLILSSSKNLLMKPIAKNNLTGKTILKMIFSLVTLVVTALPLLIIPPTLLVAATRAAIHGHCCQVLGQKITTEQ